MRRSILLLIVSAALNVVFAVVVFSPARRAQPAGVNPTDESQSAAARSRPQVVVRKQFFSWGEVESPDYRVYISRLREIGCPESTIRDIVVADVNQLYASKQLDEVPTADEEWWRSVPDTNLLQAASDKSRQLEQERRTLLDTLLGPNWTVEGASRPVVAINGPVLGELSPEAKQSVRDIVSGYQQRTQSYLAAQRNNGQPADPAELARLEQQYRAELAKVLSPAQLEEFLLRYSQTAVELRNRLRGLNATPDEFRKIFELRDTLLQQGQAAAAADPSGQARAALNKQLEAAITNVISPDRYRELQLAQDPAYQAAVALGGQYNASSNVVENLYEMKLLANQVRDRINNDPTLTPEQKAEQLRALDERQQSVSDQLLGLVPPETQAAAIPLAPMPPLPPTPMAIHPYSPGETIDQIAAKYGVTANSIINANPQLDVNSLTRGAPIKIPPRQ